MDETGCSLQEQSGACRPCSVDQVMDQGNTHGDDPVRIAGYLMKTHGNRGALDAAVSGALVSRRSADNYRLSVWRDVMHPLTQLRVSDT